MLEQKAAGILTTGYPCGFKRTPTTRIRPDVPLLVLMGSERLDHYLLEAHLEYAHGAAVGVGSKRYWPDKPAVIQKKGRLDPHERRPSSDRAAPDEQGRRVVKPSAAREEKPMVHSTLPSSQPVGVFRAEQTRLRSSPLLRWH